MKKRRVHLQVTGLVQGVSYRACARDEALLLSLGGWVKNLSNGDVEAMVEGDSGQVDRFIEWAKRGPPEARVERVTVVEQPVANPFTTFQVQR